MGWNLDLPVGTFLFLSYIYIHIISVHFSDDFLAFFESTVPPKIKTSSATKSKKPSTNAVKVLWGEPANPVRYYFSFHFHYPFLDQMPVLGAHADSADAIQKCASKCGIFSGSPLFVYRNFY